MEKAVASICIGIGECVGTWDRKEGVAPEENAMARRCVEGVGIGITVGEIEVYHTVAAIGGSVGESVITRSGEQGVVPGYGSGAGGRVDGVDKVVKLVEVDVDYAVTTSGR